MNPASIPRLILLLILPACTVGDSLSLTGYGWNLWSPTAPGGDAWRLDNVSLPGDVYLSLYENGKTSDPYYRNNDVKLRWISRENWTYQRSIEFPTDVVSKKAVVLVATGLDTITDIFINDKFVGNASNAYRTYVFDIRSSIRQGDNTIRLEFASPVNYSRDQAMEHKRTLNYSIPLECPPSIQHGECYPNFIRKLHAHFSWDWGPAFPTSGLNGDLTVQAFDTCLFKEFSVLPMPNGDSWLLQVEFWLYCIDTSAGQVTLRVVNEDLTLNVSWTAQIGQKGVNRFYNRVEISKDVKPDLWWPNGMGKQSLYEITGAFSCGNEKDTKKLSVGFRRVELVQDPIPNVANGSTFYFKINNVPTFLKGSNWIPGDSFLTRLTEDRLLFYFESMREANMNCIRVWGGGVYETDRFYELADQYGITLWQDMMFAVDLYPSTPDFLSNVEAEIYDNINRLKHHPSILIWAGNNENELGLADGWYKPMDAPIEVYKRDYLALYNTTIYGVINQTDFQARPYVFSSPSNGIQTVREGGLAENPGDNMYGDVHFYSYDGDAWNWKKYPIPRCVTEFGFQSFPSMETFRSGLVDGDLHYFSPQMIHRQHHPAGELEMLAQMVRHFKFFGSGSGMFKGTAMPKFENIIYMSQIHQAMAYKTEVEHYRRWRSTVDESGQGMTMCALYWQLNDIWQAPTWASIDYGLKWKMAHYFAKKFYAPVLVSPYIDGENLNVAVVNDLAQSFDNLTVVIDTYDWNKFGPVFQTNVTLARLDALSATFVFSSNMRLLKPHYGGETLPIVFDTRIMDSCGQQLGPNNVLFPDNFRDLSADNFGKVAVNQTWLEASNGSKQTFGVSLVANKLAPFVWLDVAGVQGYFSDNGFSMMDKSYAVVFNAWEEVTLDQFKQKLTVKTLVDLYRSGSWKG